MAKKLSPGDEVSWNTPQGQTRGTVKKVITKPMKIETHKVAASKEHPEVLVQSEKSGKLAAHLPESLHKSGGKKKSS